MEKLSIEELKDFLESVSNVAAASRIISGGIQYVDNASFWQWMRDSYPKVFKDGIENWLSIHPIKGRLLIQTKGLEWDTFRSFHPNFIDLNELSKSTNDRIKDLSSFNPLNGETTIIQVKAPLSEGGIRVEAQKLFTYPPETKFSVNQSVYDEAINRGMPQERFVRVVPDDAVKSVTEQRYQSASGGEIDVGISFNGVLEQVGKGALIGSVLYMGVSALSHYRSYKSGQMSYEDFSQQLLKDGTKGAIMGGSISAINVGVQYAATALGVGAPVTIPVMLVISIGLKKLIDPIFGDGEYAETLSNMNYHTTLQQGWINFATSSMILYEKQKAFEKIAKDKLIKGKILNLISGEIDKELNNELENI